MYRTTVIIDGMHCPMCESQVKGLIRKLYPNASLSTAHKKGLLSIEYPFIPSQAEIRKALESGGYQVKSFSTEKFEKKPSLFARLFHSFKTA